MSQLKVAVSKQLKRIPPLFDSVRRVLRLLGDRNPIYDLLTKVSTQLPDIGFIQIGSNDGISVDPLREFVVAEKKWHGTFVEPVPQIFEKLKHNYSHLPGRRFLFLNVAASHRPGMTRFWKIKDACLSQFPPFASQIGSFDRGHILKHFQHVPDLDSKLEAIEVPCMTYAQIREQSNLKHVHVLHLDVEGQESQILNSIDVGFPKPLIILFEVSHMSGTTKNEVFSMLRQRGYYLRDLGIDCIATSCNFE